MSVTCFNFGKRHLNPQKHTNLIEIIPPFELVIKIVKKLGYDLSTGMIRETEHPFTNDISSNDVRITTHIHINNFASNLFSMAHEGGHGIYGQNIDKRFDNSILKDGASMAFHESQSRFYENIVSRSEAFSKYFFPRNII